ncbi:TetR/AcrR family transcriptional regulator [Microbacterium karelineae]|uniref:TetR/AcrR family transcriptional regulator n=1 Tax=Microbacterium karelineae TaxID=2654283 RepID=UPI0012E9F225|nr:TetR/AcrR family transcriptional regulator [Microbacterium karelineae]
MTSTPERDRLLDLVADLILREGMIDVSLSAIARGVGSNNRMLLYYFESKENLLDEASVRAFDRFERLRDLFARLAGDGSLEDRLLAAWDDLSAPENVPYLRMYFQRFGVAMRDADQWASFTERAGHEWVDLTWRVIADEGHGEERARVVATEIVALWRGLQFALLTGVDPDRLRAAYGVGVRGALAALDES